ncbi:hypothetical protein [uncultured Maribacter sp.]|uniref:hypothetical protein n=1 Tax=uncultured Maribacter sp. TaxID=431308 RepID=UPI0026080837|nr:hypothetical protein [uncultured Maribacter sp.]
MKAFLKITTVVAFMFIAAISMAKEPKLILTAYSEAKTLVLELENASNNTYIKLKDNQGNVIYAESVSNDLYSKKFNLKNLEDGVYFFETEGDFKSTSYSIKVEDNKLVILDKKEVLKPYFKETEESISINLLNLDKEDVMIKIYDEDNRVVFEEDVKDKMVVEKSFDFSKAYEGNYTLSVTYGEKSYEKFFIVN